MDKAEARVKRFESERHEVKIAAVFDTASVSRAHKLFSDLDNQLSREAMQRLRSSPQGSVLGALNALFSPHPVTGAPSPQQAASNGLLGRMIQAPGGGGPTPAQARDSRGRYTSVAGAVLTDPVQARAEGAKAGREAADAASEAATVEARRRGGSWFSGLLGGISGSLAGVFARRGAGGTNGGRGGTSGNSAAGFATNLAGGIGPGILGLGLKSTGIIGLGGSLAGALPALLGGIAPLLPAAIGAGALGVAFKGVQSQISPVSQAISQAQQAVQSAQTPAQAKAAQQQLAAANAQLGQLSPALQSIYKSEQQISNWWKGFTSTFAPLFAAGFSSVATLLTQLTRPLHTFFSSAATLIQPFIGAIGDLAKQWLPLLSAGFRAAAPVIRPLIDGIGSLVTGLLPGLNTLIKASAPAVAAFGQVFGTVGKDIGTLFKELAPVLKPSAVILKALLDLVGALFPVIGKLAQIFASALAPVFTAFAAVVKSLLPFLVLVGKVLGALAGAVLGDLVSAFGALAQLLQAIAPSLTVFAKALSDVFNVLENTGIFAILGNALEDMVKPLAVLINALLRGLTPILPVVINFVSQLSTVLAAGLAAAIVELLPPLTELATKVLASLATILPAVLPALASLAGIFTAGLVVVIGAVADTLAAVINAIPPSVLNDIVGGLLAIIAAVKVWAAVQAILNIALDANPIGLILIAVAALAVGIFELYKHWSTVWAFIKQIAEDAWHFIWNGFGKFLLPLLGPVGLIALGVIEVWQHWQQIWGFIKAIAEGAWRFIYDGMGKFLLPLLGPAGLIALGAIELYQHWHTIWGDIQTVLRDFWHYVWTDFGAKISSFLVTTLPGWFKTAVSNIGRFWGDIENVVKAPIRFVIDDVLDGLISVFDTITNAVGLGKPIPQVHPFGLQRGGRLPGYGGGDKVPAMLELGETVIDKDRTRKWGWLFSMMGVPGFATGGLVSETSIIDSILGSLGAPTSSANVDTMAGWIALEQGRGVWPPDAGRYNPMNTTLNEPGATNFNSVGVKNYVSWAQGVQATVSTLSSGLYASIVASLRRGLGVNGPGTAGALSTWSGGGYSSVPSLTPVSGGGTQTILTSAGGGGGGGVLGILQGVLSGLLGNNSVTASVATILQAFGKALGKGNGGAGGLLGSILTKLPSVLANDAAKWIYSAALAATPSGGGGGIGGRLGIPGGPPATGSLQKYAQALLAQYGWSSEWGAFADIVARESNWNVFATNPSSGAYGIPQALPPGKMASAGADWRTNGFTQLRWMMAYIKSRWVDPNGADANERQNHWYGNGGIIGEPVMGYGLASGHRYMIGESGAEAVIPLDVLHSAMAGGMSRGQLAGIINIQLPEGATLAQALRELNWQLTVARMQNSWGVNG